MQSPCWGNTRLALCPILPPLLSPLLPCLLASPILPLCSEVPRRGFPGILVGKEPHACQCRRRARGSYPVQMVLLGWIPGLGKCPAGGQRRAWQLTPEGFLAGEAHRQRPESQSMGWQSYDTTGRLNRARSGFQAEWSRPYVMVLWVLPVLSKVGTEGGVMTQV